MARRPVLPAVMAAALVLTAAASLAGCGREVPPDGHTAPAQARTSARPSASPRPIVVISDRYGPSWSGVLGDTVRIDWYDQATGRTTSELVAVLAVKRLPSPDEGGPDEYGGGYGPYEWKFGIKVRLTSLDARAARRPLAYQFLQLSDGRRSEDGVSGLGESGGPDPSRPGVSSAGWLRQWTEQDFSPTRVVMHIGAWRAVWSLRQEP